MRKINLRINFTATQEQAGALYQTIAWEDKHHHDSKHPPFPLLSPGSCAKHENMWNGISLGPVEVSSALSQLLVGAVG